MLLGMKSVKLKGPIPIGRATAYMTSNYAPTGAVYHSAAYGTSLGYKAFDGDLDTQWTTNYTPYGWITYYFDTPIKIGSFRYLGKNPGRYPKAYTIQVSDNNTDWTTVLDVPLETDPGISTYSQLRTFEPVVCSYVKLDVTSTFEAINAMNLRDIEYIEYS